METEGTRRPPVASQTHPDTIEDAGAGEEGWEGSDVGADGEPASAPAADAEPAAAAEEEARQLLAAASYSSSGGGSIDAGRHDSEPYAAAAAAAAGAAAMGGAEGEPHRPASRSASEEGSEEGSETDFMALPHRHALARARKAAYPLPAGPAEGRGARAGAEAESEAESQQAAAALPARLSEERLAQSPFIDVDHPVTVYEAIKLVLLAPVVLLKLFVLAIAVPYAWLILALLLLGHKPQTPMSTFRQFLVQQWIHQWGRFLLFVAGFYYIPVQGWHNMRAAEECRAILVFNHPSYVDAAAMATFFTPSGVSKAGVANIPFIGLFGIALQLFFVERKGSGDKANRHVLRGDAVQAIAGRAVDPRFPLVAIAPEATTKAKPCLLQFRRGAFSAGQPVCPALLQYRYRHFNPGWGICNTPFHVYRLLAQFVNHLDITVLPPIHPSDEELRDWQLYAESVRRLMGQQLGMPLVEEGLAEERQLWRMRVRVNLLGTRVVLPTRRHKVD